MSQREEEEQQQRRSSVPVLTVDQICHIQDFFGNSGVGGGGQLATDNSNSNNWKTVVGLVYVHASWTTFPSEEHPLNHSVLISILQPGVVDTDSIPDAKVLSVVGSICLDQSEDAMAWAVGDDDYSCQTSTDASLPIPPAQLPVLALAVQSPHQRHAKIKYLTEISPFELLRYIRHHNNPQSARVRSSWSKIIQNILTTTKALRTNDDEIIDESDNTDVTSKKGKKRLLVRADADTTTTTAAPEPTITTTLPSNNSTTIHNQGQQQQDHLKDDAIRIFIAGDRSSVGKSSVCLGILGNLIQKFGFTPSQLAYIKPATQCEAKQLVQTYCESVGIDCVAVGPLVYYKGFTRAFLAGETGQTTQDLLESCGQAVDNISRGKKIVLVDGVGFPAVGSIVGTDNASVSKACGYPSTSTSGGGGGGMEEDPIVRRHPMGVVLVGGSGVGAAVDAFNLNSSYFEMARVPVMGGIFNKLSTEGYYSLENCRTQLTSYFSQNDHQRNLGRVPFGFVPLFDGLSGDGDDALQRVDAFVKVFGDHVNIQAILESATRIKQEQKQQGSSNDNNKSLHGGTTTETADDMEIDSPLNAAASGPPPNKRHKPSRNSSSSSRRSQRRNGSTGNHMPGGGLSRKDIEELAAQQGAATA